jgi:hypothetical protein
MGLHYTPLNPEHSAVSVLLQKQEAFSESGRRFVHVYRLILSVLGKDQDDIHLGRLARAECFYLFITVF